MSALGNISKGKWGGFLFFISFSPLIYADLPFEEVPVVIRQFHAKTNAVTESGERADATDSECIDAGENMVWNQPKVMYVNGQVKNESSWSCNISFKGDTEVIPGITLPKTACFNASVVSIGGFTSMGKRGEVWCNYTGTQFKLK